MLAFFADTDSDITPAFCKEYGINLISMPYSLDNTNYYPYITEKEFDDKAFYKKLRSGAVPKTSALNPQEYIDLFKPFFEKGDDIIYVHFSKEMSGTFNAMNLAVSELKEQFPQRNFYTINTKAISGLAYVIVEELAKMYRNGATSDEMIQWANDNVDKYAVYFYADSLNYLRRSGRLTNISALLGSILDIHPIINIGSDGKMRSIAKGHARIGTLKRIIEYMEEIGDDISNQELLIFHCDANNIAELFIKMLKEKFGENLKTKVIAMNPTAGCHCGPDCIGVAFRSTRR